MLENQKSDIYHVTECQVVFAYGLQVNMTSILVASEVADHDE